MSYMAKDLLKVSLENETIFLQEIDIIFESMMKRAKFGYRNFQKTIRKSDWSEGFIMENIKSYILGVDSSYQIDITEDEDFLYLSISW